MTNDLIPSEKEFQTLQMMAKNATQSKFFASLNGESGILSIMLYAKELGLPVMQCLFGGMHNINGKIEISARLMNSMVRKAGHRIDIEECTDQKCLLKGTRKDTGETAVVSMSLEEAKRIGIAKATGVWAIYPSDMLFARCLSRLARRLFPDIIGSAYVEGEVDPTISRFRSTTTNLTSSQLETVEICEETDTSDQTITEDQCATIDSYLEVIKDDEYLDKLQEFLQVVSIYNIKQKDFDRVIKSLEKRKSECK